MSPWFVLVNPRAGRRSARTRDLETALSAAGVAYRIRTIDGVDQMREEACVIIARGDRLAITGGDGTVSVVVDALIDAGLAATASPVGVLPVGTGCDLLRTFGHRADLETAAARLAAGSSYPIDVGYLDGVWGRRHFVNVAQAGIGAAAVQAAVRLPRSLGAARYPLGFARRLVAFPRAEVTIAGDRWPARPKPGLAVIMANGQFFGGGWNIAPKAMLMDGELDVQIIDAAKPSAPVLVPKLMRGLHLREPGVTRRSMSTFRLETAPDWPIEADGDMVGSTPVEVGVLPKAIALQV